MKQVKFGLNQLYKPTPAMLNKLVQVAAALSLFTIGMVNSADFISDHAAHEISWFLGYINGALMTVAPFFGIQIAEGSNVKAKDVNVMENK